MYLCYVDESGVSSVPGNTSHFVLAGLSIPIWTWKACESSINVIKKKFDLEEAEIHTGWIMRKYLEQSKIKGFENLDFKQRRSEVEKIRNTELLRLQRTHNKDHYYQTKKNFQQTKKYVHLTFDQRRSFIEEVVKTVGDWSSARLFAECIDKIHFDPTKSTQSIDEQAFEQVVSRFQHYLKVTESEKRNFGIIIHDNNETVAKKHTNLMKRFHKTGTFWTRVENIIETPLFVNSELTSMIQIADVCSYVLRRYLENKEEVLFNHIYKRADKKDGVVVGVRHFTGVSCKCLICSTHRLGLFENLSS